MNPQEIKQIEDFVLNHRELVDAVAIAFGKGYAAFISELDRYDVINRRVNDQKGQETKHAAVNQSPSRPSRKAKARVQKQS